MKLLSAPAGRTRGRRRAAAALAEGNIGSPSCSDMRTYSAQTRAEFCPFEEEMPGFHQRYCIKSRMMLHLHDLRVQLICAANSKAS